MARKWIGTVVGSLALLAAFGLLGVRAKPVSRAAQSVAPTPVSADAPRREMSGGVEGPAISFIDSPSATCYRAAAGTGDCHIQWSYLSVTATSGQYIITMTVTIDNELRGYHSGFFQTSMYIPADLTDPGYRVACGAPGSGGVAGFGRIYSYVIRARETGGLGATNYGSVMCPADIVKRFLPLVQRQ